VFGEFADLRWSAAGRVTLAGVKPLPGVEIKLADGVARPATP